MISGIAYGVVLNDRRQLRELGSRLNDAPYLGAPQAPVMFIKPRTCFRFHGAAIPMPDELERVEAAATLGLLFDRDVTKAQPANALSGVAAACLALEVCEPHDTLHRPAIRQRCRDGFLPLGAFTAFEPAFATADIHTVIDGRRRHTWSLSDLARPVPELVAAITEFMTLRAGDLLMVGLPGDAPTVEAGEQIEVTAQGLPALATVVQRGSIQ